MIHSVFFGDCPHSCTFVDGKSLAVHAPVLVSLIQGIASVKCIVDRCAIGSAGDGYILAACKLASIR